MFWTQFCVSVVLQLVRSQLCFGLVSVTAYYSDHISKKQTKSCLRESHCSLGLQLQIPEVSFLAVSRDSDLNLTALQMHCCIW